MLVSLQSGIMPHAAAVQVLQDDVDRTRTAGRRWLPNGHAHNVGVVVVVVAGAATGAAEFVSAGTCREIKRQR